MPTLSNPRHEQFAQFVVAGKSLAEAYALSFGNHSEGARVNAHKLSRQPAVVGRVAELRSVVAGLNPVLTMSEKRSFLRSVVTTPIGGITEHSVLAQSFKRSSRTSRDGATVDDYELRMPDKLRALELDAKLAGELDGDGPRTISMVNVSLLGVPVEQVEAQVYEQPIDVEQA